MTHLLLFPENKETWQLIMVIMCFESNLTFAREVPYSVQSEYIITACSTTVKVLINLSFSMVTRMLWSQKLLISGLYLET